MRVSRVPPTRATKSARKPICKDCRHSGHVVNLNGQWLCSKHLIVKKAQRLTVLPEGVEDPDDIKLKDVFPNRRARRLAKKSRS